MARIKALAAGLLFGTSSCSIGTDVEAPDFTVEILLSETARAYLQANAETVVIDASFADFIGPGWNYLGGLRREIPADEPTTVLVRDIAFDPKNVDALKSPNYEVLLNIYSGRRSVDVNVLDCDVLQGLIGDLQRKVHRLQCELLNSAPAVPPGFSGRIACEFSDDSGALFRSDWMTRHRIAIDGQLIEFQGEAKMSDAGWFQTFTSDEITLTLSLRRLGDRGDTVPMRGEIVVAKAGESNTYQMTGYCGA